MQFIGNSTNYRILSNPNNIGRPDGSYYRTEGNNTYSYFENSKGSYDVFKSTKTAEATTATTATTAAATGGFSGMEKLQLAKAGVQGIQAIYGAYSQIKQANQEFKLQMAATQQYDLQISQNILQLKQFINNSFSQFKGAMDDADYIAARRGVRANEGSMANLKEASGAELSKDIHKAERQTAATNEYLNYQKQIDESIARANKESAKSQAITGAGFGIMSAGLSLATGGMGGGK
ncbi:MAG: hypothetical protein LBC92_00330 [Rickettsiales bacterium]|jgi:hypothetical protein|nr:hypothetical protein [Rickettsiales bacterium]